MAISALKKRIAGGVAALVLGTSVAAMAPTEASAQWRRHGGGWRGPGVAAGVVGGLALGALAAGAYNSGGYGAYDNGYYAPAYGGDCYITRQRVWDGYGYRLQRVRVCN